MPWRSLLPCWSNSSASRISTWCVNAGRAAVVEYPLQCQCLHIFVTVCVQIRVCQQQKRAPGLHELVLDTNLKQNGVYLRRHVFEKARDVLDILDKLWPIYAKTTAHGIRAKGNLHEECVVSYVGKVQHRVVILRAVV